MDDHQLVQQAAEGDEVAFEVLVRRHLDAAWRLARLLLRDDHAAEEAVQDTFLKAHRSLDRFRGDAAFPTWLLTICRRVCIDRLRRKSHEVVSLDEVRTRRARQADTVLRLALEEAVGRLPDEDREAFTLVDVLGHSREEAARIAGVPSSTMRSRVARARERLASQLSESDAAAEEA